MHKCPVSGMQHVAPRMASGHQLVAAAALAHWKAESCYLASSSNIPCRTPLSLLMSLDGDYCNDQHSPRLCVELEYRIKAETGRPGDSEECHCIWKPGPNISARLLGNWLGSVKKQSLSSLGVPRSKDAQSPRCDELPNLSISYMARKGCPQVWCKCVPSGSESHQQAMSQP